VIILQNGSKNLYLLTFKSMCYLRMVTNGYLVQPTKSISNSTSSLCL